ncbi:MAG: pyrimidine reductase family protein [Trebonia sp.]
MIFPSPGGELDLFGLAEAYGYPRQRWLRANFVTSADGAAWVDGRSAGLSSDGDKRLFGLLRVLADVVLVGAGTARIEEYKATRRRPSLAALRDGRPSAPAIAVVSRSLALNLSAPLFTEAPPDARTIVITCAVPDAVRRAAAAEVADVIVAGEEGVDLGQALDALAGQGLGHVLCEGGPHLLGDLAVSGLLDELSLSVSPTLAGPGAGRIIAGPLGPARPLALKHVIADDDGFLFCRYVAEDRGQGHLSGRVNGPLVSL